MMYSKNNLPLLSRKNTGFTLMEILVATTVFSVVFVAILSLFFYAIKLNRQIEAVRKASQTTRTFTEFLVREIRNGTIDYSGAIAPCPSGSYPGVGGTTLGVVTVTGDQECFYLSGSNLLVTKRTSDGIVSTSQVNPTDVTVEPSSFRFIVRPVTDPRQLNAGQYLGVQPVVAILMNVQSSTGGSTVTIPYQTTVSIDAYDIPARN